VNTPHSEIDLRTYLKAFFSDWLTGMCGPLSVPFAAFAALSKAPSAKVLWAGLAIGAFFFASYRVWRKERNNRITESERLSHEKDAAIAALKAENQNLKRKPYEEELGRQAEALVNRMSPDGRELLRHLLTNEPIEQGRRFRRDISQEVQDTQLAIAHGMGIIRYSEIRHPSNGTVIGNNYVINPQFRSALEEMLY
jgi:hypothetical protein